MPSVAQDLVWAQKSFCTNSPQDPWCWTQICVWQKSKANHTCCSQRPFPQIAWEGNLTYLPLWMDHQGKAFDSQEICSPVILRGHRVQRNIGGQWPGDKITGLLSLYLGKHSFNPLQYKGKSVPHIPTSLKPPQNASVLDFLALTAVTLHGHSFPF